MKKIYFVLTALLLAVFLFVSCTSQGLKDNTNIENTKNVQKVEGPIVFGELKDNEYTEGKVLVGYTDKAAALEVVKLLNGKIVVDLPEINMLSVEFKGTVAEAYRKIKEANIKGIKYIEPSYKRELIKPLPVENKELASKFEPKTMSLRGEEEFSTSLWGLEAIGATEVWPKASGTGIIVAVVDTGVDGTHPDLEGQVIEGYRPLTDKILPAGTDSSYGGAHGTHVAGTIAAKKDGKGIVGVAPNAKIMPIVIFDINRYVGDDYVAAGIIWAVKHGAKVMNHSWGGWGYSHTLKAAFDYALDRGVLMVVSAGNDHTDQHMHYPSGYPGVIQVAAAEYYGGNYRTVWFSNRSDAITVAAPGVKILSTVPMKGSIGYESYSVVSPGNKGTYDYYQGTSMASPHVTGVVALLLQKYPNAKPWQIRKLIQQTAVDIDDPGFDHNSGYGLVNVKNAFSVALPSTGGASLNVLVTDAYESWKVPTVFVTLKRLGGVGGDYFAKTDNNGIARFSNIDAGKYEVILGGPDSYERAMAVYGSGSMPGGFAINWRMEEERQISEVIQLTSDATKVYNFESEFKVKFTTPLSGASIRVSNYLTGEYEIPYNLTIKNLSSESGFLDIFVNLANPANTDTTIQGTVILNGYQIPVRGFIPKDATSTKITDAFGENAWWTVFGKK